MSKRCPRCRTHNADDAVRCDCGTRLKDVSSGDAAGAASPLTASGFGLIALSIAALLYLLLAFDTTMTPAAAEAERGMDPAVLKALPDRVVNFNRMQVQQNGIIVASAGLVAGVILVAAGNVIATLERR
jgi:hypothetical protein